MSLSLGASTPIEFFHGSTASCVCEHLDASGATTYHDEATCRAQLSPRVWIQDGHAREPAIESSRERQREQTDFAA